MKKVFSITIVASLFLHACNSNNNQSSDVQTFLDHYTTEYVKLYTQSSEAQWKANIEIKAGDSTNATNAQKADEAMAAFTGSKDNISQAKKYLSDTANLTPIQKKQLEIILYAAANNPQTIADVVKQRIKAETEQTQKLYGYQYVLDGKKVSTNEIDDLLKKENNVGKRLDAWNASKEIGKTLKPGLVNLRDLRNRTVRELGYNDFFSYQVSDYNMKTDDMMQTMDKLMRELHPLYRELHTWMRYELAKRYGVKEVPDYLPAHWLPNRWGQDWSSAVTVKGIDLDKVLGTKSKEWIVHEGEKLYTSIGFPSLPETFWQKSSLYPYPPDSSVKKNNHASAWHMDLNHDVRSLMSIEPNAEWWETANHELGHIYYYLTYTNKDVPPLLRAGANRAYHEAIGTMMGLAAMQKPYLIGRGLIASNVQTDSIQSLLKEALNSVVFMFFSCGTMSNFEKEMYADNLSPDQFNARWWELAKKYQGIVPPNMRGEEYCDAATKTHINDDPAQYYDYALSYVILYQLHNHIAKEILHQDPRSTNYFGQKGIGDFLNKIMYPGASKDWRAVLKESTGDELNAKAMLDYFQPLVEWLKQQNAGRKYTLESL
ncbi:MAG: M2 family metallopeptidase [Bacteroidetes bacterium]|nr:M2 family metallopeptidase [Bacteroidota bacterium]MBS1740069.1 M2 family metallopeptidase [Bacteroidota bacterium]MBS1777306.1 M2 family metallopeptidase [Bacteroidota bacterium]